MKQITNLTMRPVVLGDGTILAAAKTKGSFKEVENLSDADARRLAGSIHVSDVTVESKEPGARSEGGKTVRTSAPQAEQEKK